MKVTSATFMVEHKGKAYRVDFEPDTITVTCTESDGTCLSVHRGKQLDYKPCATHAMELARLAIGKPATNEFEKRRRKDLRPKLWGVVRE